ncbi:MAG TPA: hypothetical protein V6C96_05110 [Vampirovibrionales bacterium]
MKNFYKVFSLAIIQTILLSSGSIFASNLSVGLSKQPLSSNILKQQTPSFSQDLSAVPDCLKEGKVFEEASIKSMYEHLQMQVEISEIPLWLYGTWVEIPTGMKTDDAKYPFYYDVIGDLRNQNDEILSISSPGSFNKIYESEVSSIYLLYLKEKKQSKNVLSFNFKEQLIQVSVSNETGIITDVIQLESQRFYKPIWNNDAVLIQSWVKSFSQDGIPGDTIHFEKVKVLFAKHQLFGLGQERFNSQVGD